MNKNAFVLVVAMMWCLLTQAQQQVVFEDDFSDHLQDWKMVSTKEFTVNQNQEVLNFSKKTSNRINHGCLWYKKTVRDFYAERDFSISFSANGLSSESDTQLFDFQWGKIQEYDGIRRILIYQLDFTLNSVRLAKFESQKGWKYYSSSIEQTDKSINRFSLERNKFYNYEISQQAQVLTVKINDKIVYVIPIEPILGSEIGCLQGYKGEWQLDNLVIKQ